MNLPGKRRFHLILKVRNSHMGFSDKSLKKQKIILQLLAKAADRLVASLNIYQKGSLIL